MVSVPRDIANALRKIYTRSRRFGVSQLAELYLRHFSLELPIRTHFEGTYHLKYVWCRRGSVTLLSESYEPWFMPTVSWHCRHTRSAQLASLGGVFTT